MSKEEAGTMRALWVTPLATIVPEEVDHQLCRFNVYLNGDAVYLGSVYPADLVDQEILVKDLNDGSCPLADHWEDGAGNTCGPNGWGQDEDPELIDLLPRDEWDNKGLEETDLGHHFFLDDYGKMYEHIEPAIEEMRKNTVKPAEYGLYDLGVLEAQLVIPDNRSDAELQRGGTAECLLPFIGRCNVAVEEYIPIRSTVAKVARWIIDKLKDEEYALADKQENTKELQEIIERIVSLDEGYVSNPPRHVITISSLATADKA